MRAATKRSRRAGNGATKGLRGRTRSAAPASRRAFTLIEVVVVISIILFLVGLTLSVSTVVIQRSEIRQTENTLRLLDLALQEWEAQADRQITWGTNGFPNPPGTAVYDMQGDWTTGASDPDDIFIISELLRVIRGSGQVKDIIARIDPDFVHTYVAGKYPPWITAADLEDEQDADWVGELAVIDAWGTPIYPIHPGPLWNDVEAHVGAYPPRDEDGTARIYNETEYGIAKNRRICFVSAGPDGDFGTGPGLGPASIDAKASARADNIYSYQPLAPPEWDPP